MSRYSALKTIINQDITTNGQGGITGAILNQVLKDMVDSLGAYYQFGGIATPTTNPGNPDQRVFYIATIAGTYKNFGSLAVPDGFSILKFDESWSCQTLSLPYFLNSNVVSSFVRSKTQVMASNAVGLFVAQLADNKINTFVQEASNQIRSAYYYRWSTFRACCYVKHTDSNLYKIMIYQYDESYSLVGYGEMWPNEFSIDSKLNGAVYFNIHILCRNADDTANVPISASDPVGFEVYTNYLDAVSEGLTLLDNSIFTLLGNSNGMLTKAVAPWGSQKLHIVCLGPLDIQAMIYQYDANFNNIGYTEIWSTDYKESPKSNAKYFDIRVAKRINGSYQPITQDDLQYIQIYSNYVPFNKGLTINMLGDSLTSQGYITGALEKYGYKINNYGVAGTAICLGNQSFIHRYAEMTDDCDIILVLGGVNDWRPGVVEFGDFYEGAGEWTFYAALHTLFAGLKNKYINYNANTSPTANSNKRIYICTPLHNQYTVSGETTLKEYTLNGNAIVANKNTRNDQPYHIFEDYVDAEIKVAKFYAIPVIDTYAISGFDPIQEDNFNTYSEDGLHPNVAGGKMIADSILKAIE